MNPKIEIKKQNCLVNGFTKKGFNPLQGVKEESENSLGDYNTENGIQIRITI